MADENPAAAEGHFNSVVRRLIFRIAVRCLMFRAASGRPIFASVTSPDHGRRSMNEAWRMPFAEVGDVMTGM